MTWLAKKLRHRGQIRKPILSATEFGGRDLTYETLMTVWCGLKPLSKFTQGIQALGSENTGEKDTHEIIMRLSALDSIGKQFSSGFSFGFDSFNDLNPLKADMYIFIEKGSNVKGILFKISSITRDDDHSEFVKLYCREMTEHGTGKQIENTRDTNETERWPEWNSQ